MGLLKRYHRCKLEKLASTHNLLRTDTIEGVTMNKPTVGHAFTMFGDSLDAAKDARMISTSTISEVDYFSIVKDSGALANILASTETPTPGDSYEFRTRNSSYRVTFLD